MKKSATSICIVFVVLITGFQNLFAGCGGVCLSTQPNIYSNGIDTAYLDQNGGEITMYAVYNSCCAGMMNVSNLLMQLVWLKDGIVFDTTNFFDVYSTSLGYVTEMNAMSPGVYEVFFIDFQGEIYVCGKICILKTEEIKQEFFPTEISETAGISTPGGERKFNIYPNPSSQGYFYIDHPVEEKIYSIRLLSLEGKEMLQVQNAGGHIIIIEILDLPNGIYFVNIQASTGVYRKKLIVDH